MRLHSKPTTEMAYTLGPGINSFPERRLGGAVRETEAYSDRPFLMGKSATTARLTAPMRARVLTELIPSLPWRLGVRVKRCGRTPAAVRSNELRGWRDEIEHGDPRRGLRHFTGPSTNSRIRLLWVFSLSGRNRLDAAESATDSRARGSRCIALVSRAGMHRDLLVEGEAASCGRSRSGERKAKRGYDCINLRRTGYRGGRGKRGRSDACAKFLAWRALNLAFPLFELAVDG